MPLAFRDGLFLDKNDIAIRLDDCGFSRGLAFFETMRVYGGKPFHLDDHLMRLQEGAATLGLTLPSTMEIIHAAVKKICAHNAYAHSVMKFYFTAGESAPCAYGMNADLPSPHLIITEEEKNPDHPEAPSGLALYERGLRVKIMPMERPLPEVKSISYMSAYIAAREAGPAWDDILFTHRDGFVTEASRANVFAVIDGVLCTPDEHILDGVTRKVVLDCAAECGLRVALKSITPADLARASEAFLTSTYDELVPIGQIDDRRMPTSMGGSVFRQLRQAFSAKIAELANG